MSTGPEYVGSTERRLSIDLAIILSAVLLLLSMAYWLVNSNFAWIFLTGAVLMAAATWLLQGPWLKNAFLVLSSLFASLLIAEVALYAMDRDAADRGRYVKGYSEPIRMNGGPLGYAPKPGKSIQAWKIVGRERVYDVTYTTDAHGFRVTPGVRTSAAGQSAVVFFGCSFTFGEGLDDDETLPYYFAERVQFEHSVINAGFSGYGPHQMLRLLELGTLRDAVSGTIRHAVYTGLPHHAYRAAGRVWWDPAGPRYAVDEDGTVRHTGRFTEVPERWIPAYYKLLQVLEVARRSLFVDLAMTRLIDSDDSTGDPRALAALYSSIVIQAARELEEDYQAKLHVLFWDDDTPLSDNILEGLAAGNIHVIKVSDYIPLQLRPRYRLRGDLHPNASANRVLAVGLAARIAID